MIIQWLHFTKKTTSIIEFLSPMFCVMMYGKNYNVPSIYVKIIQVFLHKDVKHLYACINTLKCTKS